MKILWITNSEPDVIAKHFDRCNVSGSWINYSHILLSQRDSIELYVLSCGANYDWITIKGVNYAGFFDHYVFDEAFEKALDKISPDVVHIWGTEYEHFLQTVLIMKKKDILERLVVSIQGLVSVIDQYYSFALPWKVQKSKTIYERLRHTSIEDAHKALHRRGLIEKQGLSMALNCIGRTDFDRAIIRQYNEKMRYYYCNEILRESFYDNVWSYDECEKHTVVFSQAGYILKGFHVLVDAIEIVKKFYPDVKVYAVGESPFHYDGVKSWIKRYTFLEYVGEKIKEKGLRENISFVGFLNEQEMIAHYKRGNVFVCASGIENSSNSVGEAMMLGMPIVASDVGGIKTFIEHNKNGILYQSDSANMLADGIMRIFENVDNAIQMGNAARNKALDIYEPEKNTSVLVNVYNDMINRK